MPIIPAFINGGTTLIGPSADGSADQVLKTNGSGQLSFTAAGGGFPQGYASGMITANNSTDSDHDIDITAGVRRDDTDAFDIELASDITKRFDATFVAGDGNGGLDTGSLPTSGTIHIFAIAKADGTADVLASTSLASPTMPSGYTYKRRIASLPTDGSANILAYRQSANRFWLDAPILDLSDTTPPTSLTTLTTSLPSGVELLALIRMSLYRASTNNWGACYDFAGGGNAGVIDWSDGSASEPMGKVKTNTSAQIKYKASTASGWSTWSIYTTGWEDYQLGVE